LFGAILTVIIGGAFFAALPATPTYQLNSYGFGSGGTANSNTPTYSLEGITGEISSTPATTPTYQLKSGFIETQQANVPKITLSNSSSYYDKLHFLIDQQSNPSDALYLIQICVSSDFPGGSCGTPYYLHGDDTISTSFSIADYHTYSFWGGGSGQNIIGLTPGTNYYARVKATQGEFTESGFGPSSGAATSAQSITFCAYSTDGNCASSAHSLAFGNLLPATVTNSPYNIGVDFATNANLGGQVYIYSSNTGLKSTTAPGTYTITSTTADLSSASEGFGARVSSSGQSSGGPFNPVSPYDNITGNNIGGVGTSISTLLASSNPLVGGTASILLKAKSSSITPAASDYSDILTVIAAANF
jgi:hypothetical protein